jgi:PAS domain S-box-containing protein
MKERSETLRRFFEELLPWVILSILLLFTYSKFFIIPYIGFEFSNGRVGNIFNPADIPDSLMVNDRIVKIGSVSMEEYKSDIHLTLFQDVDIGDAVPIKVLREGQELMVDWIIPGPTLNAIFGRMTGIWWIAYVFWFAGTSTIVFQKPEYPHKVRTIALFYLSAILIAALSGPSSWHIWPSPLIYRSTIWLCIPVYLHFHWEFPKPIKQIPTEIWKFLYLVGIILVIAEWLFGLSAIASLVGIVLALAGSFLLIIMNLVFNKDSRQELIPIAAAFGLISALALGLILSNLSNLRPSRSFFWGIYLLLPILPGAYFFAGYWNHLKILPTQVFRILWKYCLGLIISIGIVSALISLETEPDFNTSPIFFGIGVIILTIIITLISTTPLLILPILVENTLKSIRWVGERRMRVNRFISIIISEILLGTTFSIILLFVNLRVTQDISKIVLNILTILVVVLISSQVYPRFHRLIDRRLFGKNILPLNIVQTFTEDVSTSLNKTNLITLLKDTVLPSLLLQNSVLFSFENDIPVIIYSTGIKDKEIPSSSEIIKIIREHKSPYFPTSKLIGDYPWLHIIIPLVVNRETKGIWLVGKKEREVLLTRDEFEVLRTIASLSAIVLSNINQQDRMNKILQENIYRHEEERRKVARDLHDVILNGLAALGMTLDDNQVSLEFENQYRQLTQRIRRMISGLRPPSLDQGLWLALSDLLDGFRQRLNHNTSISFNIESSEVRYHPIIEGHIFRIIQQAGENVLKHAKAERIIIDGELSLDRIMISVVDDGRGFFLDAKNQRSNLGDLAHYGITVMQERAELIDAELHIHSEVGKGTKVEIILEDILKSEGERQARLKAEKSLKDREDSFKTLVDSANYGILMFDENGIIIYGNSRASEISGFSIIELTGMIANDLTSHLDNHYLKIWSHNSEEKQPVSSLYETMIIHKNGESVPIELTISQTLWNGKSVGMALFNDISEQKKLEIALNKSTENFKKLFDHVLDGVVLADINGQHVYINHRFSEITGYSINELLGLKMSELINPENIKEVSAHFTERIVGINSPSQYKTSLRRKDGTMVPITGISTRITWQGQPVVMAFVRDLIEQEQIKTELRQSEGKFKAVVDNANDGILVADTTGKHIYANPKAAEITGYSIVQMLTLSMRDLAHPDDYEDLRNKYLSKLDGEFPDQRFKARMIRNNGEEIHVEISAALTLWNDEPSVIVVIRKTL